MTRKDLAEKKIDRLESMEQAIEVISILEYDECLAALNGVEKMPSDMHKALMDRAKSLKGVTFELIVAGMQAAVNCQEPPAWRGSTGRKKEIYGIYLL